MTRYAILVGNEYIKKFVSSDIITFTDDINEAQLFTTMSDALYIRATLRNVTIVAVSLDVISLTQI